LATCPDNAKKADFDQQNAEWWIVLSTPSNNPDEHETTNHQHERRWPRRFWEKACGVSISDWLMVLFTGVIAFYAYSQWAEMHGAVGQTNKLIEYAGKQSDAANRMADAANNFSSTASQIESQTENAVKEVGRLAVAAQQSARTTQQAFSLQELSDRPKMTLQNVYFVSQLSPGIANDIIVEAENTGNTPALGVQMKGHMFVSPYREMTEFHVHTAGQDVPSFDIAASHVQKWHFPVYDSVFDITDIPLLREHVKIIYIAGFMTYTDRMQETLRDNFCAYYLPEAGTHFVPCQKGYKIIEDTQPQHKQ
jgi:hypothetical protein